MKNANFDPIPPPESTLWRSRIATFVPASDPRAIHEAPLTLGLFEKVPSIVESFEVKADSAKGIVAISLNLYGKDRDFVRFLTVGLGMAALETSDIDPLASLFIGGNVVTRKQFETDRAATDQPISLRDERYQDNDGMMIEHMRFKSFIAN